MCHTFFTILLISYTNIFTKIYSYTYDYFSFSFQVCMNSLSDCQRAFTTSVSTLSTLPSSSPLPINPSKTQLYWNLLSNNTSAMVTQKSTVTQSWGSHLGLSCVKAAKCEYLPPYHPARRKSKCWELWIWVWSWTSKYISFIWLHFIEPRARGLHCYSAASVRLN